VLAAGAAALRQEAGQGVARRRTIDSTMGEMASEAEEPKPIRVVVVAPEHLKQGVYANTLQIRFTENDFVIDCAQALPPETQEDVDAARTAGVVVLPSVARIVVPAHLMPRIIDVLRNGLEKYERLIGPVPRTTPSLADTQEEAADDDHP
jgi:hypothetical protein